MDEDCKPIVHGVKSLVRNSSASLVASVTIGFIASITSYVVFGTSVLSKRVVGRSEVDGSEVGGKRSTSHSVSLRTLRSSVSRGVQSYLE